MTDDGVGGGPLDVATLEVLGQRAASHPLVDDWAFEPDTISPRQLVVQLDTTQYPAAVDTARLEIRWFVDGDYAVHYLEARAADRWQCRWDRHPKPGAPRAHVHPPPSAGEPVEASDFDDHHHLTVLFSVLDWLTERVAAIHDD